MFSKFILRDIKFGNDEYSQRIPKRYIYYTYIHKIRLSLKLRRVNFFEEQYYTKRTVCERQEGMSESQYYYYDVSKTQNS